MKNDLSFLDHALIEEFKGCLHQISGMKRALSENADTEFIFSMNDEAHLIAFYPLELDVDLTMVKEILNVIETHCRLKLQNLGVEI